MPSANTTDNGTVYELHGRADLPLVVLIHGLGLNRRIWADYVVALLPRYRVLVYDLFGHGDSVAPPKLPSLALFVEQLCALLDALDIPTCVVVGFSLGGMINRRFAMDYPERVAALVIFNSPHERDPQALIETRARDTKKEGIASMLDRTMARWFTAEFQAARPEYIAQTRAWLLANDPEIYAQCRYVLAAGVLELLHPQAAISCPTLVITCENDSGSTPAMAHAIAADIAGAQTHVVAGLQHMGLVEQPQQFTTPLLQFLDEVTP